MTTKKITTKGKGGKAARPKLSTPTNARKLAQLLTDPTQTETGRHELIEWADDLFNAHRIDPCSDPALFRRTLSRAARIVEGQRFHDLRDGHRAYRMLQAILTRTGRGETLAEIRESRYTAMREHGRELARAALAAPEPKDKLSAEWRYWQLRQVEADFKSGEPNAYGRAWAYFHQLLDGLRQDREFERADFALALLPHLICARQEIDETVRYERRMRVGMKGAETRQRNAQKGAR